MKIFIGVIFALIPALAMSVPIGLFVFPAGLLIFTFMFDFGLSVLFGEDEERRKL